MDPPFCVFSPQHEFPMHIIDIPPIDAKRLVPLLQELHALHVTHQPARHPAAPSDTALVEWLNRWLTEPGLHALAAESPQGDLLGYLIYQIEERVGSPLRAAETRAVLHHIAVAKPWQRMGIGKALITESKARVLAQDVTIITTSYATFNTASAALMRAMGLLPVNTTAEWRADAP